MLVIKVWGLQSFEVRMIKQFPLYLIVQGNQRNLKSSRVKLLTKKNQQKQSKLREIKEEQTETTHL